VAISQFSTHIKSYRIELFDDVCSRWVSVHVPFRKRSMLSTRGL